MATKKIDDALLTSIADAIRTKTGGTTQMTPAEMSAQIEGIQSGEGGDTLGAYITGTLGEYTNTELTEIPDYAFADSGQKLKKISFPNINSDIKTGSSAFNRCGASEINIGPVRTIASNVTFMFANSGIETIPFADTVEELAQYTFHYCAYTKGDIVFPKCKNPLQSGMFTGNRFNSIKLKAVDPSISQNGYNTFYEAIINIIDITAMLEDGKTNQLSFGSRFMYSGRMGHLILRTNILIPASASDFFSNSTYAYVPAELVDTYKTATNWATYADKIRPLEDYTVDGTIYGDLDKTKI